MGGGDVRPTLYVSRPTVLSRTSTFCTGGRRPSSGAKRLPPIAAQNTTLPHPAMKVLRAWFVRGRSKRTGGAHSKLGTIATSGGGIDDQSSVRQRQRLRSSRARPFTVGRSRIFLLHGCPRRYGVCICTVLYGDFRGSPPPVEIGKQLSTPCQVAQNLFSPVSRRRWTVGRFEASECAQELSCI